MNRFTAEKLSDHLYRIVDALEVACYLVTGRERACLLDTCTGAGDLRRFVQELTGLPLTVVVSHGHMDHLGGAGRFEKVFMKKADMPIFQVHRSCAFRAEFFSGHLNLSLSPSDFAPVPEEVFEDLPEDTVLDLGGVTVELLSFPGHTPGMVCPLIPGDRILIIGDACDDNVLLLDQYSSTVSEYRDNLKKMKDMSGRYDRILGNHGSYAFTMELIDNVLESCDRILARKDAHLWVHIIGEWMYSANAIGEDELRLDGKPGNVLYSEEKVK